MRYTFTQASTGEEIETRDLPDLRAATQRGKELHKFGHVLISSDEDEEADEDEDGLPSAAEPSAPIPEATKPKAKPAAKKPAPRKKR